MAAKLHQWRDRLTKLGAAWSTTTAQLQVMPPATSPARQEDALLAVGRPDWPEHEALHAGLDAVAFIDAAARHVSGLRTLLADGNLILTTWPLTRAAVEHIAHAGWLLDPDISAEQRVSRRWMIRLADAYRHRRLTKATRAPNASQQAAKRRRDQIRDEVARRFPNIDLDWDQSRTRTVRWTEIRHQAYGASEQLPWPVR